MSQLVPSWFDNAACRDVKPNYWFHDEHTGGYTAAADKAKAICADCPVIVDCREASRSERWGIWAGTSPHDRGFRRSKSKRPVGRPRKSDLEPPPDFAVGVVFMDEFREQRTG